MKFVVSGFWFFGKMGLLWWNRLM